MRTHYDNLNVSEKASPEVIKAAYKALAQKWHPDKHPNQREKAERYFKIITRAFEILSDSESRAAYDLWLRNQRSETQPFPEGIEPHANHSTPTSKPDKLLTAKYAAASGVGYPYIWFLYLWNYLILPTPVVLIIISVLFSGDFENTPLGLIQTLNAQQIIFITFSSILIIALDKRQPYAWYLNWIPLLAAPALAFKFVGFGAILTGICGAWLCWSTLAWVRLKPIFFSNAEWLADQKQQSELPPAASKPLKGKIWGGWKGFFYSYPVFTAAYFLNDIDLIGALIFSAFSAAVIGLVFAIFSDLEMRK